MKFLFVIASLIALSWATNAIMMRDLALQNPDLFEGDIHGIDSVEDRNAIPFLQMRWRNGVIPFVIDKSLARHTDIINSAMDNIMNRTSGCITFKARTNETNYIRIFKGEGCYSDVGMQNQGAQPVSLGNGCHYIGTIIHELLHAVGFYHEQNRSDRDDYLFIYWGNITEGMERKFAKLKPYQNTLYDTFDYSSIMIFGEYAFSKVPGFQKTMVAKKAGIVLLDPLWKHSVSDSDAKRIKKLYDCA